MNEVPSPELFLENVIEDTFNDKIDWLSRIFEHGLIHLVLVGVPGTMKFLKLEVFEIGKASFVRIEFHTGISTNKITFQNIKSRDHAERIQRLIKAIQRQNDARRNK